MSKSVYRKLRQLKDSLNIGYSDLLDMLIETYRRYRVEELKRLCDELKVDEKGFNEIRRITKELRKRRWW